VLIKAAKAMILWLSPVAS